MVTNWLHDGIINPYIGVGSGPTLRRTGFYNTSAGSEASGMLGPFITEIGSNSTIRSTTEGMLQQFATGAVANANAGLRQTTAQFRREWRSYMILRVIPSSTSDIRAFIGWSSDDNEIAGQTTLDNFSGVGVGKRTGDTNWFTYRNDGDATEDRVDSTIAFAASAVTIELELDSTSFRSKIGGVVQTAQTTELPAAAADLYFHCQIETGAGAADKNIQIAPIFAQVGHGVMI